MIIKNWLEKIKKSEEFLRSSFDGNIKIPTDLERELIMLEAIGENDRTYLVAHGDRELTREELKAVTSMHGDLMRGRPLAYILGKKEFYGRNFYVDESVLIPRPETEVIIDELKNKNLDTIVEIGTGSGCIAISAALETEAAVTATDISDEALKVARKNAEDLKTRIVFRKSDLLKDFSAHEFEEFKGKKLAIVANLPYVDKDWDWISDNLKFEPEIALYANNGGLELIFRLIDQLSDLKNRIKDDMDEWCVILESDVSQHENISKYALGLGFKNVKISGYSISFEF